MSYHICVTKVNHNYCDHKRAHIWLNRRRPVMKSICNSVGTDWHNCLKDNSWDIVVPSLLKVAFSQVLMLSLFADSSGSMNCISSVLCSLLEFKQRPLSPWVASFSGVWQLLGLPLRSLAISVEDKDSCSFSPLAVAILHPNKTSLRMKTILSSLTIFLESYYTK